MGIRIWSGNCRLYGGSVVLYGNWNIPISTDRGSADDCFVRRRLHGLARHFEASERPAVLDRLSLSMKRNAYVEKHGAFLSGSQSLNSLHQSHRRLTS